MIPSTTCLLLRFLAMFLKSPPLLPFVFFSATLSPFIEIAFDLLVVVFIITV